MYNSNYFRGWYLVSIAVSFLSLMVLSVFAPTKGTITKEMVENAEAIYAGTANVIRDGKQDVITLTNYATLKGQWQLAKFVVDHVVKGPSVQQVNIEFFSPPRSGGVMIGMVLPEIVPLNKRCLVFLVSKKDAEGSYRLLDPLGSSVIFLTSRPPTQLSMNATVLERLQSELLNAMMAEEPYIACLAIRSIANLNLSNEQVMKTLGVLSKDKDKDIRIVCRAIARRIRLRDKAAIREGKSFLESGRYPENQYNEINVAIEKLRDTECIDELKELFGSRNVLLRRSAILALSHIKDKTTLLILEKALKDTDTKVQFLAINGLLDRTANTDPEAYKKWQEWWEKNKDRVLEERRKRAKRLRTLEKQAKEKKEPGEPAKK